MCLIVDANIIHKVLSGSHPEFEPVHKRLFNFTGSGAIARMVHGGKLTEEYVRAGIIQVVRELDIRGHARSVDDELIKAQAKIIGHLCKSNDEHIIALARADKHNVRLLCSEDDECARDFTNKELLDKPRGKVYRNKSHSHLLSRPCKDLDLTK